jgi:hypothetical protein
MSHAPLCKLAAGKHAPSRLIEIPLKASMPEHRLRVGISPDAAPGRSRHWPVCPKAGRHRHLFAAGAVSSAQLVSSGGMDQRRPATHGQDRQLDRDGTAPTESPPRWLTTVLRCKTLLFPRVIALSASSPRLLYRPCNSAHGACGVALRVAHHKWSRFSRRASRRNIGVLYVRRWCLLRSRGGRP